MPEHKKYLASFTFRIVAKFKLAVKGTSISRHSRKPLQSRAFPYYLFTVYELSYYLFEPNEYRGVAFPRPDTLSSLFSLFFTTPLIRSRRRVPLPNKET